MTIVKKTEKTWRKKLIDELEERLEMHNMLVYDEISFKTPTGSSFKIPDITILDRSKVIEREKEIIIQPSGVIAIVETKREDVHDGILQALQYVTYIEHIGVSRGCFSTNYRQVIGVIFEDTIRRIQDETFGRTISDETISSAANFIADLITGVVTAPPIELKDETIIRILNASVNQLSAFTGVIPKRKLEQLSGMFFAKTLDLSIMENESSKKEFEDAMAKAAAYLIVNQILFYHLLSSAIEEFEPLKSINDPEELQELFNKVLSKDFEPVFGSKIAGFLPKNATSILNQIINAVKSLKLEQIRRDVIGKVFHGVIPETIRKRIAAYYTKNTAAELLANLCIKKAEDIVVDLACGSGTLLVAAYTRKKELYTKKGEIADHKKLLSEIYGIDISLFAGHLSAVHLSLQEPIYYTEDVNILIEDAFNVAPGFKALTIREIVEDKVIKEGRPVPHPVDVIIMNPPFTSVERLERRYVERTLLPAMKRNKKEKWTGGRGAGLHIYFLLHADGFLRKGGYIGAVLPESMLDYVKTGIKQYLLDNYHIEYIISSDVEYFSEQTDFRDMLLIAKKGKEDKPTKFVMLKAELSPSNIKEILRKIKKNYDCEDNDVRIRIVNKKELEKETLWSHFLRAIDVADEIKNLAGDLLIEGKEVFGRANVGFEAFGVNFFFIPNKYWEIGSRGKLYTKIINKYTKEALKIPNKFLVPSLRNPKEHSSYITPKVEHFVLSIPKMPREKLPKDIQRYIEWAEKTLEIPAQKKFGEFWFSHINHWIKKWKFKRIAILEKFLPTTKAVSAHLLQDGVIGQKTYYFVSTGDYKKDKALVAWFNSSLGLLFRYKRRMILGKASERLLAKHIETMPCLNVDKLKKEQLDELSKALDEFMKNEPLPPVSNQIGKPYREKLDMVILKILEVPERVIEEVLKEIYEKLKTWIIEVQGRK